MSDGLPESEPLDTSRQAFMAAIVKLADDAAFRESFLRHYQLWLHPPIIAVGREMPDDFDMRPGAITFVTDDEMLRFAPRLPL